MALINFHHFSEELKMQMEALVIIPQKSVTGQIGVGNKSAEGKYKCLYLLHGLSDDNTIWERRTSIERYATKYGIAVVMPNGHRSFYTNMKDGGKYYSYIANELPRLICEFFNISDKREDNFVAGLSMGGYGALKIGIREPNRFAGCAGLSSAIDMQRRMNDFSDTMISIFGREGIIPEEDDVFKLLAKHEKDEVKPKVYLACGLEDGLYPENQDFKKALEERKYDFVYRESHGSHTWEFWDEYIQYVLDYFFEEEQ